MLEKLNEKVKKRINEYLEFDSDIIFNNTDYCEIFGGAVRDSIADDTINDIDFLCLSNSSKILIDILKNKNYKIMEKFNGKDIQSLYKDIHCIFEPITLMNKNFKCIQIIRPVPNLSFSQHENILSSFSKRFFDILREVDISCCGISYNGKIRENVSDAILHSLCKIFEERQQSEMYHSNRYYTRSEKLKNRGWSEKNNMNDKQKQLYHKYKKVINRNRKLLKLN